MQNYINSALHSARNHQHFSMDNIGSRRSTSELINNFNDRYSTDRRYKLFLLAESTDGYGVLTAIVKYRNHKYYSKYDNTTKKFIEG